MSSKRGNVGESFRGAGPEKDSGEEYSISSTSSSSSSSSSRGRPLGEEPWFHGYLLREDLERLLRKEGDFGVRYMADEKVQLVLSILGGKGSVDSFLIHESRLGTFFVQRKEFESVSDLVVFHQMTRTPVAEGREGGVLRRGVGPAKWELPMGVLVSKSLLGQGEFGSVWKGVWKGKSGREISIAIKENRNQKDVKQRTELLKEARLQLSLDHSHIVRCLGISVRAEPVRVALELVNGGTLLEWIRRENVRESGTLLTLLKQLLSALVYLEARSVVHRDVAARNCLLTTTPRSLKLSDFGLALRLFDGGFLGTGRRKAGSREVKDSRRVPIKWTAPEALAKEEFSTKSDVYSFGVVVWEVFSGGLEPWANKRSDEVRKALESGQSLPPPRSDSPPPLLNFLASLLHPLPAKRPLPSKLLYNFPSF